MRKEAAKVLLNRKLDLLLEAIVDYVKDNEASFACWRKPNADSVVIIVDLNGARPIKEVNLENSEPGFIIAPFDKGKSRFFLKKDILLEWNKEIIKDEYKGSDDAERFIDFISNHTPSPQSIITLEKAKDKTGSKNYKNLVEKSVGSIKKGCFEKVVPSRCSVVKYEGQFKAGETFTKLCEEYENAFVSMHYTAQTGLWVGATPEVLLETNGDIFRTVALAGTQSFNQDESLADVAWTQKEIEEQALVSRYIINCFKKIRLREFDEHGPKTIKAGNLIHLKTTFQVDMKATNFEELGTTMLELLHPTSAVCGMPLEKARSFILEEEKYDRELFSGYLGPINLQSSTSLFVNLRCMKIDSTSFTLFAGAGVTEDSNPEKEWMETEMKMNTLLNVINKV